MWRWRRRGKVEDFEGYRMCNEALLVHASDDLLRFFFWGGGDFSGPSGVNHTLNLQRCAEWAADNILRTMQSGRLVSAFLATDLRVGSSGQPTFLPN